MDTVNASRRAELKRLYRLVREQVAAAVLKADPIDLLSLGAPKNEYEPEIDTIVPRVFTAAGVDAVQDIVYEAFVEWFGELSAGQRDDYRGVASDVWLAVAQARATYSGGTDSLADDVDAPDDSHTQYVQGRDHMDEGDLELAVAAFQRSLDVCPHFKTLELLGECHMRQRNFKAAVAPLAAATTLNHQSRAPSLLAEVFERLGQFDDARELAQLALARAKDNRRARDVLARVGVDVQLGHATDWHVPVLQRLIEQSARALSAGYYTPAQIDAAVRYVFGVDSTLIDDGTYFVVTDGDDVVACGGWSRRRTLYGGDQRPVGSSDLLDPAVDAARIRAFFVAPSHARRGIGRMLVGACIVAAETAGFRRLELMATLPGVPLYRACGFRPTERVTDILPDGTAIEFVRMELSIDRSDMLS